MNEIINRQSTSTRTIWHPYPETKPPEKPKDYLVTITDAGRHPVTRYTTALRWAKTYFYREWGVPEEIVTAWAEMPAPYDGKDVEDIEPVDMHPDTITGQKYLENDPETINALTIFDESN